MATAGRCPPPCCTSRYVSPTPNWRCGATASACPNTSPTPPANCSSSTLRPPSPDVSGPTPPPSAGDDALRRGRDRRRNVLLAQHYRQRGESIALIARRLERAPATVKGYLYDPTGEKAKAR